MIRCQPGTLQYLGNIYISAKVHSNVNKISHFWFMLSAVYILQNFQKNKIQNSYSVMVYLRIFILLLCFLGLTQAGGPPPPIKGLKNKSDQSRNVTLSNKLFSHAQSKPPGALQARSLFGRQEECPPEYPGKNLRPFPGLNEKVLMLTLKNFAELCPDLHCCEADTVCVSVPNM